MQYTDLTDEEKSLCDKMHKMIDENGGALEHDLNDPEHRRFVKLMHSISGLDESNYPGLHKMIDEAANTKPSTKANLAAADAGDDSSWQTAFGIPQVGITQGSNLPAANAYGTVVGGYITCNLSLLVRDMTTGYFLASGANSGYAPLNSIGVETDDATARSTTNPIAAYLTASYQPVGGGTQSVSRSAGPPAGPAADPTVKEPKHEVGNTTPYDPNAINIGLGRPPGYLLNCDYIYYEAIQDHPIGRVPLVGSVPFTYPIMTLNPTNNFIVTISVVRTDSGGQTQIISPTDMANVYSNFKIDLGLDPTGKTLSWNLPMEANTVPPEPPATVYNPVVFNNIPWSSNMQAFLSVSITVTLNDGTPFGTPATAFIQSSPVTDTDPIDGTAYILPIEFIWHCLGENTKVSLADGGVKQITEFKGGDIVASPTGQRPGKISATHVAAHSGPVLQIETDGGHSLITSEQHIIMTPNGGVFAKDLKPGDKVISVKGETKVTAVIQQKAAKRNLWNLSIGEAPKPNDPKTETGVFYANGILVGDARAERALRYKNANDLQWVKANVPASFSKDIESAFLKDKTNPIKKYIG